MIWPEFDGNGDLPVGIHQATLAEIMSHFGVGSVRRRLVAERLERIHALASGTGRTLANQTRQDPPRNN